MHKFKVDENLPVDVVELLSLAGHDAVSVLDQQLGGRPDPLLASVCQHEGRALVTLDLDFADIRTYPPSSYICRHDRPAACKASKVNYRRSHAKAHCAIRE
jgi:predicted nuclease of predicted toxin-antitoxin system